MFSDLKATIEERPQLVLTDEAEMEIIRQWRQMKERYQRRGFALVVLNPARTNVAVVYQSVNRP